MISTVALRQIEYEPLKGRSITAIVGGLPLPWRLECVSMMSLSYTIQLTPFESPSTGSAPIPSFSFSVKVHPAASHALSSLATMCSPYYL